MCPGLRSGLRVDAPSCGLPKDAGYANRRRRPAGCLGVIRMWVGFVFRGPPGRRGLRNIGGILPPTPCARWGNREPGVLARLPPHRAGSRLRADVTGCLRSRIAHRRANRGVARRSIANWSGRLSDEGAPPARTPAERSSIARPVRPQDAAGCRAIPRPGGPPRTNLPTSGTQPRQPAGCRRRLAYPASLGKPQDAASRHKLNADPITSARERDPTRWGGSRARTPGSRVPHRAQRVGGRMPPMLRNPLRPGGPRKTTLTTVRISTEAAGRTPASN